MDNSTHVAVVKETLSKPDVHEQWESTYRNPDNERFFDLAFDYIAAQVGAKGSTFLDAGCGSCAHSMRLVDRGYSVCAVDFSPPIVEQAARNVALHGHADRIKVLQEDLLSMSFADGEFDNVICWGVLMHIPEPEQPLAELTRVLRPGGKLVLSELNARSPHSITIRNLKRLLGSSGYRIKSTPAGIEHWENSEAGELMTRHADMRWLRQRLTERGLTIRKRAAGELTEIYTRCSSPIVKRMLHGLNRAWFRLGAIPQPALANILIAEKA